MTELLHSYAYLMFCGLCVFLSVCVGTLGTPLVLQKQQNQDDICWEQTHTGPKNTLAPPGKYNWLIPICVWQRRGLMSN